MNFLGVGLVVFRNGDDDHLAGADEERELTGRVLRQNGNEALHTSQNSSVHDHGTGIPGLAFNIIEIFRAFSVLKLKALGKREIKLNGATLVGALHGIVEFDVNFGAVEGAIAGVQFPDLAGGVQRLSQCFFGVVPQLKIPQVLLRACGQFDRPFEAKQAVDVPDELQAVLDFLLNLVHSAENVGIVLLETTNSGES